MVGSDSTAMTVVVHVSRRRCHSTLGAMRDDCRNNVDNNSNSNTDDVGGHRDDDEAHNEACRFKGISANGFSCLLDEIQGVTSPAVVYHRS